MVDDSPRKVIKSPPAISTWPPLFGITAAPWSTKPHWVVSAAALPPVPAPKPETAAV